MEENKSIIECVNEKNSHLINGGEKQDDGFCVSEGWTTAAARVQVCGPTAAHHRTWTQEPSDSVTLSTSRRVRLSPEYRRERSPALVNISTGKLPSISYATPILHLADSWFVGEAVSE